MQSIRPKRSGLEREIIPERMTGLIYLAILGLMVILVAGWFFTKRIAERVDVSERNKLIELAEAASVSVSAEQVKSLYGPYSYLDDPVYQDLKQHLDALEAVNHYANHYYLLGDSKDQIVYLVDSTEIDTSDYSPPGQVYDKAVNIVRQIFLDGKSVSFGPYKDSRGEWVSAFVAIKDPNDNHVVGVLGFDVPQELLSQKILPAQHEPILITLLIGLIYLGAVAYFFWSHAARTKLKHEIKSHLESKAARERQFLENPAIMLMIDPLDGGIVDANLSALKFYQYPSQEFLKMSIFDITLLSPYQVRQNMLSVEKNAGAYFTFQHCLADGSIRDIETNMSLIRIENRKILHATIHDITERKRAEEQLRKLSQAVECSPVSIVITDKLGNIEYVNPKFVDVTGYTFAEAVGKNPRILKAENSDPEKFVQLWQTITSRKIWTGVFKNRKKNGETYYEAATISPIFNDDGNISHYLAVKEDITRRRQMEQELQAQRDLATQVVKLMGQGLTVTNADGRFVFVNPAYARLFGYEATDMIGKYPVDFAAPEERTALAEQRSLRRDSKSSSYESSLVRADGSIAHVLITGVPRASTNNEKTYNGSIAVVTDLTAQKKIEEELRTSEARFRSLFDDSPISLWEEDFSQVKLRLDDLRAKGVTDFNSYLCEHPEVVVECISSVCVLDVNKATLNLYEATSKEDLVQSLANTLPEAGNDFFRYELVKIASGALHFEMEMIAQTLGKKTITVHLSWAVVSGYESDLSKVIVSIINITEQKRAEDELLETNRQLEELISRANTFASQAEMANVAKSEFLANMSHEIRTPMNGVIGMAGLLLDTELTAEQRQFAGIIRSSGEVLLFLINDILDFSKVEAHKLELETLDFDLREILEDIIGIFIFQAQEKKTKLSLTIEPDVYCLLRGDPGRLRQILTNFVGNAIKFTPQGSVSVRVQNKSETEKDITLHFSIQDNGIGIPANRISSLFTPFTQVDSSTTRKYGGSGLGLAISKQLAELMNGSVGVDSVEGEGSCFWFTVLLEKQTSKEALSENEKRTDGSFVENKMIAIVPQKNTKHVNILVVEDNQINQKVALSVLNKLGFHADAVANGIEALQILGEIPYDLVLMDCQMPEMDGFTATAQIRSLGSVVLNPHVPIIAMTAHAMIGDRENCIAAGMDDYLTKPVKSEELARKIEYWLNRTSNKNGIVACENIQQESTEEPVASDEKNADRLDGKPVVFEEAKLLERLMGDKDLEKIIIGAFLDEIPKQIAVLKHEIADKDLVNARIQAHAIRGASANLAADALQQAAHNVEVTAEMGDLDGLTALVSIVETEFVLFEKKIQNTGILINV